MQARSRSSHSGPEGLDYLKSEWASFHGIDMEDGMRRWASGAALPYSFTESAYTLLCSISMHFLRQISRYALLRSLAPRLSTIRKEFGNSESDSFLLLARSAALTPSGESGHCVRKYDRRPNDPIFLSDLPPAAPDCDGERERETLWKFDSTPAKSFLPRIWR